MGSAFLALSAVLASKVGYNGQTVNQKRLAPDSLTYPVPTTLPMGFSWAMFFCQDVTDHCALAGSADSPPHHRRSLADMAWDRMASVGRALTFWEVLARGANCTDVHLGGAQKAGQDVHDISRASGSADVLGYEVSPANVYCS